MEMNFDLQRFDVSWKGATEITSGTSQSEQTYTSTSADENALLINTGDGVYIQNATVEKSGDSDGGDNCNFYGINSAIMVMGGGTATIDGGTVNATAKGANGIFCYGGNGGTNGAAGDGTTVIIMNTNITTTGDNGGGFMTTGGGTTYATNLTVDTSGQSSAAIRTDRGGGTVYVNGGTYTSHGLGSPAIYSTADISVNNAALVSYLSEGICIEGENSVALTDCTLTVSNTQTNGQATFLDSIMIYQSQSGDASDGTSTFSMNGGTLNSNNGHVFHVTNTTAIINLNNVTINNNDSTNVLLSVCDDGWSGASNIATLNADSQTLTGDILVGSNSTLTLNITDNSTFTGNISGDIQNANGDTVSSTVGTVNVTLDETSKWYLTADTYISSFSGTAANVITGSYDLYVDGVALDGTSETDGTDDTVVTALSIDNTVDNTIISGTSANDTITNSGENVTVYGGAGDDNITNAFDVMTATSGRNALIYAGTGNDTIANAQSSNITINAGDGNDSIHNSGEYALLNGDDGDDTIVSDSYGGITINGGAGNDILSDNNGLNLINGDDGDDSISSGATDNTIYGGAGNDTILADGMSVSVYGGDGDDFIDAKGSYLNIDGGDGNDTINISDSEAIGINNGLGATVNGGAGNDVITNSSANVTMSGGAGDDTIIGGDSRDVIFYANGDGNDLATNYTAGSSDNSDIVYLQGDLGTIEREGGNVTVNAASGEALIIETDFSKDEAILYTIDGTNIGAAKLADSTNTLYYDKNVYYFRFNDDSGRLYYWGSEDMTIALDNSTAQEYIGLKTIITKSDDEKASGNLTIIGNSLDNEIYSGAGNDTLTGNAGADTFYWGNGDGADVITDADSEDIIDLYNVQISDILELDTSSGISVKLTDGSQLTVNSQDSTFQLADDTRWKYQDGDWQQQA